MLVPSEDSSMLRDNVARVQRIEGATAGTAGAALMEEVVMESSFGFVGADEV